MSTLIEKRESVEAKHQCSICYEDLTVENSVATPCNHKFCRTCFFKWLHESTTCPMCRNNYVEYTEWDYKRPLENELTHEFKLFRDIIYRSKDALNEQYEKKVKLEKEIKVNDIYIKEKVKSCMRMDNILDYKRGYYKSIHFPFTDYDLYNALTPDEESLDWQRGFINGIKEKYGYDILNDYKYIVEPSVAIGRKLLHDICMNGDISPEYFDKIKNNPRDLYICLCRYLRNRDLTNILKGGIIKQKDGSKRKIGITFDDFKKNPKLMSREEIMYVDFMYNKKDKSLYKIPYYINDNNEMCYYNFNIKLELKSKRLSKHSFTSQYDKIAPNLQIINFVNSNNENDNGVEEGEIVEVFNNGYNFEILFGEVDV